MKYGARAMNFVFIREVFVVSNGPAHSRSTGAVEDWHLGET